MKINNAVVFYNDSIIYFIELCGNMWYTVKYKIHIEVV